MQIHKLFLKRWSLQDFFQECPQHVHEPLLRVMLTLDGTITRTLQAIHLRPIEVDVIQQSTARLDRETAQFLEGPPNLSEMISREVWLRAGRQRLLFASTLLAFKDRENRLKERLNGREPLGAIIEASRLPSMKDKMVIGRLIFPEVAQGFGLAAAAELWARHYRLCISDVVRASVLEIFSPAAIIPIPQQ